MKKVLSLFGLFILFSGCNPKKENTLPAILDFNLKCNKAFYVYSNEGFAVAFQVQYQNASEYAIYLENSPQVLVSPDADKNSTGFMLNKGEDSLICLSRRAVNKYIPLKEKTYKMFYLYLVNRGKIEDLMNTTKTLSIDYVGRNLNSTQIIGETEKSVILKTNNISIPLKNMTYIKVTEREMLDEDKLSSL
ncbi:hypothetical protein D3C87_68640 [compost metagenome]